MRAIDRLIEEYEKKHQHPIHRLALWFCIPAIVLSILGLLYALPIPAGLQKSFTLNWAFVAVTLVLLFYLRLSSAMFIGFVFLSFGFMGIVFGLSHFLFSETSFILFFLFLFTISLGILTFDSIKRNGKPYLPIHYFQLILIGPAWLLHHIFLKVGIQW